MRRFIVTVAMAMILVFLGMGLAGIMGEPFQPGQAHAWDAPGDGPDVDDNDDGGDSGDGGGGGDDDGGSGGED